MPQTTSPATPTRQFAFGYRTGRAHLHAHADLIEELVEQWLADTREQTNQDRAEGLTTILLNRLAPASAPGSDGDIVEVVAQAICEQDYDSADGTREWDGLLAVERERYRLLARAALNAAVDVVLAREYEQDLGSAEADRGVELAQAGEMWAQWLVAPVRDALADTWYEDELGGAPRVDPDEMVTHLAGSLAGRLPAPGQTVTEWAVRHPDGTIVSFGVAEGAARDAAQAGAGELVAQEVTRTPWRPV